MNLTRRDALTSTLALLASGAQAAEIAPRLGPAKPFSFDGLKSRAAALAATPYKARPSPSTAALAAIDYDAMSRIRFRRQAALWADRPGGAVEFFHLGRYARDRVIISVVQGGEAREVLYAEQLFEVSGAPAGVPPGEAGFAGFRVMNPGGETDWIAYQGAAYFRAATPFNQYGLSARGLAVDTATAGPEEFPAFTHFWLAHDVIGDLVVFALLDGPSVAGAYRIVHRKRTEGLVQEIEATLHFRRPVDRLGVAPLTSMYWYGLPDAARAVDWRPQVHDSDGLAMWTGGGERIWRPLANPPRVITNAFLDHDPRGFGLMQRDRRFEDYQDDGVFYDRRPSVWVEPIGAWGAGSVQLVEIPTNDETNDNIVAFWTPSMPATAGASLTARYRLHWCDQEPTAVGVGRVVATRLGRGGRPGQPPAPGVRKFVIDFAGGALPALRRDSGVVAMVTASVGQPSAVAAYPVVGHDHWRLMFDLAIAPGAIVDLRAFLRLGEAALTETWSYQVVA